MWGERERERLTGCVCVRERKAYRVGGCEREREREKGSQCMCVKEKG